MSRALAQDDILEIFLQPGEFYFGDEKTRIRTLLGSCVAVTLWHPRKRIGGMCHYMLPTRPTNSGMKGGADPALDGRYADEAMQLFMRELRTAKTRPGEYQVKLFGGGNMFAGGDGAKRHLNISERNVEVGREMIMKLGFRLAAEDLGGKGHRNVILELWNGDVWVRR
jgi:chemotaxis protein CheD